jgi:hypothetical protein
MMARSATGAILLTARDGEARRGKKRFDGINRIDGMVLRPDEDAGRS